MTPDNAALLMMDHQTGISNGVADQSIPEFNNNFMALAKVGKVYNLPTRGCRKVMIGGRKRHFLVTKPPNWHGLPDREKANSYQSDDCVAANGGLKFVKDGCLVEVTFDFRAHEKTLRRKIDELLVADDIQRLTKQHASDRVDEPATIRTFNVKDACMHFTEFEESGSQLKSEKSRS